MSTESDERGQADAALSGGHRGGYEHASFVLQGVDGSTVVLAAGEIDVATSPALRDALIAAMEVTGKVVVDLSAVTFLDSTGLGVLMGGFKNIPPSGSMCLVGAKGIVAKVLRQTRLDEVIPVHANLDDVFSTPDEG